MKRARLDSKIRGDTVYELFDILEKHGFVTRDGLDTIADLTEKNVEKLYIDVYSSVFGVQTTGHTTGNRLTCRTLSHFMLVLQFEEPPVAVRRNAASKSWISCPVMPPCMQLSLPFLCRWWHPNAPRTLLKCADSWSVIFRRCSTYDR